MWLASVFWSSRTPQPKVRLDSVGAECAFWNDRRLGNGRDSPSEPMYTRLIILVEWGDRARACMLSQTREGVNVAPVTPPLAFSMLPGFPLLLMRAGGLWSRRIMK